MDYFFWAAIQGFRRGQSQKVYSIDDFDKNTKNGLKSSFLSFIYRETAQNDANKILYTIVSFMVWTRPAPAYLVIKWSWLLGNFLRGWSPAEIFHMEFFLLTDC
jgi:hypothetical protein